ncbi:hypothetical protein DFH09DRAFT_1275164 [Mycena vulgaris]|nr:hypothetical protein DFH09DRAFT_1275164 [Mycena vulgaris]
MVNMPQIDIALLLATTVVGCATAYQNDLSPPWDHFDSRIWGGYGGHSVIYDWAGTDDSSGGGGGGRGSDGVVERIGMGVVEGREKTCAVGAWRNWTLTLRGLSTSMGKAFFYGDLGDLSCVQKNMLGSPTGNEMSGQVKE